MDGRFVGIDVSKNQLDGRVLGDQGFQQPNAPAGIAQVVALMQSLPATLVVVEATGGLEVPVVRALQKAQIPVAVINPRQGRDFAKASGRLAKTDRIDAETLAMFGQSIRPRPQPLPDEATVALDAIVTRRSQLIDMRTMEQNRLHQTADAKVRRNIEKHLDWLNQHIDDVDRELGEAVKDNPAWQVRDELQQSIPGIGKGVSLALLAGLPELGTSRVANWRHWWAWRRSRATAATARASDTLREDDRKCVPSCSWAPGPRVAARHRWATFIDACLRRAKQRRWH